MMCGLSKWFAVAALGLVGCGSGDADDDAALLLDQLNGLDGVRAEPLGRSPDGSAVYDLRVRQPVDHTFAAGETFEQRVILRFTGRYSSPVVLLTDGYQLQYFDEASGTAYLTEPASIFNATQIEVEHRYFASSIPSVPDWSKLDIAQAAADHHRVRELLAPLLTGAWVATGGSKSGMAAVFYRYFYPEDVSATVAYVTPLMQGRDDPRFVTRLQELGDAVCRADLVAFQREALSRAPRTGALTASRRSELVRRIRETFGASSFTLLDPDLVFEIAVIDMPFLFWQYADPRLCQSIPDAGDNDSAFFNFLTRVFPFEPLTDAELVLSRPYRYQLATQLGTRALDLAAIADLLIYDETASGGAELPATTIPPFDPVPVQQVASWMATASEHVMLIYGANDPWTAGAIAVSTASKTFTATNANHGAEIQDLSDVDRQSAYGVLEQWTGIAVDSR